VKPAPVQAAKPAPVQAAKPAEKPKKESTDADRTEFSSNPCKGPQAKFLSTCQ
jgi:septal ring-binding cell division protein DamX